MKQYCRIIFASILCLFCFSSFAADQKYNVLFIAVDDLRPDLGCYGHPLAKSPNIDGLAKQSLQFNRAYCQFALCNPSRSSLLTGRRPETLKVLDLETFVRKSNPGIVTLPQLFKQNGYRSLSYGKIFHTTNGNHDDPESWSDRPGKSPGDDAPVAAKTKPAKKKIKTNPDPDGADRANDMPYGAPAVEDNKLVDGQIADRAVVALRAEKDKPFFIGVGFHRPHMPFVAPKKYWDLYDPKDIKLAPNPYLPKGAPEFASNDASEVRRYKDVPKTGPLSDELSRNLIHSYLASVSYMDAQVGKVLAELDRLGLREKTIVILWGDHGYQLGEHGTWNKRTNWEIATRVPLMISVPGQKSGQKTEALVELVDMYPTLTELCKIPVPSGLEGTSFVPLLKNKKLSWKKAAFSTYAKDVPGMGETLGRAMRTERYRFVEWAGSESEKRVYELYDHKNDAQENVNIVDLPKNKKLVAALTEQLHAGWKAALPKSISGSAAK